MVFIHRFTPNEVEVVTLNLSYGMLAAVGFQQEA